MVGNRLASMVLPGPGGPIKMILCPPAAAISIHRLMLCCPFTSEKSNRNDVACETLLECQFVPHQMGFPPKRK